MNERIVKKINEFLKKQGITKVDLAKQIGMKGPALTSQLNNTRGLSVEVLIKIFQLYPDLNKEWVFNGKGSMLYSELRGSKSPEMMEARIQQLEEANKNLQLDIMKKDAQIELLKSMVGAENSPK